MFGGLGIKVKRRDGSTSALTGRAVGQNIYSPALADVELNDGRIVAIPIRQARGGTFLPSDESRKDGFTKAGSTSDDMGDPIIDEADLTFMESPSSFDKDEKGSKQGTTKYTDQAYDVVKFDDNKRALADLSETNKRRAEQDLDDAAVDKQGETDPDSGKQFWDPSRPIYAVSRRGGTPFAYTQNWNDAQQRIAADQRFLDEEEGRTPLARITQDDNTPEDETPLVDQQDKFKKEEIARLPEQETAKAPSDFKYKVPENTYEITDPKAPYRSVSEYDDPASLANMFQGDELIDALDDSMDTGLGRLQFPEEGEDRGGEQEVPAEAILKAIDEKGGDAELALAQAYDKRLGTTENEDALSAQREADREGKIGEPKKLGEVFDEVTKAPEPETEAPAEEETPVAEIPEITEDAEPSKLPALLEGLTEEEKADFQKNGDYTPYLPKDGPVDWPEGSTPPQDRELTPEERKQALELANSDLSDDDLIESYNGAVKNLFDENGSAPFGVEDENSEVQTVQIPSEVLRDAIKLRDYGMDEVNRAVLDGAYDPVEEKAPIKFKKNKETGRMEHDLGDNTVVSYGKDESGNWSADATRFSPDGGVDAEENYPAKNKKEARQLAEDVINSYNETQDIIDPADLPEQPAEDEEEAPVAELPESKTPAPIDEKIGSKAGKDPLKEGYTVDEWLNDEVSETVFHDMLKKNKDFTRLAALYNDPTFNSPLMSDYQDQQMEGFESGSEAEAIDIGEQGFEPTPAGRISYAMDLLENPDDFIRGMHGRKGARTNQNLRNILNSADEQFKAAQEELDETDVFENKAIDSIRATLAKEIAKLDKQIEKDKKVEEEAKIAPQIKYLLNGDRLELRSGKKVPLKDQRIKDFLDENGFEWNDAVKAETKSGMDEAKARDFLRKLRDNFGLDLIPREGQPPIDLDSKDEVIETPPLPEAAPASPPSGPPNLSPEFLRSLLRAVLENELNGQRFPRSIMTREEQEFFDSLDFNEDGSRTTIDDRAKIVRDMMDKLGVEPSGFGEEFFDKPEEVSPKEKSLKEREDEEFGKFLPLPETLPDGWVEDEERGYNEVYFMQAVENENGDRIVGTYSKDGSAEPYWSVIADFDSPDSFKSFEDALDFYNKNSGKQAEDTAKPETPEDTTPVEDVAQPETPTPSEPSSLNDKILKRDGIQMIKVTGPDGQEIETPVFNLRGRPMVLINVNGVRIPFYISSGKGGKKNVPVGKWYPIFGIGSDGWFNKGFEEEINDYYGSPELRAVAEWLDSNMGDIRKEDMPKVSEITQELRDQLNRDLSPGQYYASGVVYANRELALARINGDKDRVAELEANLDRLVADQAKFEAQLLEEDELLKEKEEEAKVSVEPDNKAIEDRVSEIDAEISRVIKDNPEGTLDQDALGDLFRRKSNLVGDFEESDKKFEKRVADVLKALETEKTNIELAINSTAPAEEIAELQEKLAKAEKLIGDVSKYYKDFKDIKFKVEGAKLNLSEENLDSEEQAIRLDIIEKGRNDLEKLKSDFSVDAVTNREPVSEETVIQEAIDDAMTGEGPKLTLPELIDKLKRKLLDDESVGPFGSRRDMISKLMVQKWGYGLRRMESPYIQRAMSEYRKELKSLSDEELIAMVNNYYDEMDARLAEELAPRVAPPTVLTPEEAAEEYRKRRVKEIKERKKREREDKLLEEDEKAKKKEEPTPTTTATPEVVEEAPTTPEVRDPKVKSKLVEARKISALTSELQPGDVTADDYFTITKIEPGFTKRRDGVSVPSSWITGYYPGSKEQRTKLWADDITFDIYRGATPPAKGDLEELSKPDMKESGAIEPVGVDSKGNNVWDFKNPADKADYEAKLAEYKEELERRKATWQPPEVEKTEPAFTPANTLHVVNAVGKDLKPGDIAFKKDGDELGEFFVIEEVLPGTVMVDRADGKPAEEKVQIRGYYPGHESQVKAWKVGTGIDVLRGEDPANIPAKGDKPGIESIAPGTLKGQAYKDKNAEIAALRKEASKGYTPNLEAVEIPKVSVNRPSDWDKGNRPAFIGSAAELAKLKDGAAIWEALKGKRVVYFDFETIGKGFDSDNPDQPIQVAAAVFENGEKVDEINLFINPGVPLDDYYYSQGKGKNKKPYLDKDGNRALNPERVIDNNGTKVDDAFLATQPGLEEQLRKFAELLGKDAILIAHNAEFDTNTFEKWAQKLGIDYNFSGVIDTLELARTFGNRYNDLEAVAKRYGIEKDPLFWHNAASDSEVLPEILEKLLKDAQPDNPQFSPEDRMSEFNAQRAKWLRDMADWKKQETDLAAAAALKDGLAGKPVPTDAESLTEKPESSFGPDGSTESADEHQFESIFGGTITNSWIEDDENTFIVDEGNAKVQDIRIGDFVPAKDGGYHEVIDLLQDPEDPNGTIVVRKIVASGNLYSTRVTKKNSPGIGWANGETLKGTLRRRNELAGKTPAEIRKLIEKPVAIDPVPTVKPKVSTPKGSKTVTTDELQSVVGEAIKTITSGSKTDASSEEAIKGLPVDDTVKSLVLEDRTDGSMFHLSASGVPLKVGDRVRGVKTGRMGEVKAFIGSYGTRGYKNYVKVKFDDAAKRENISAGALEIINPDDGGGFFKDPTPPSTGEPVNPNTTPKSLEEIYSTLETPEASEVVDREARTKAWKENEEKRMKYALDLNYRKVSPEALKELTEAVNSISVYGKGHRRSFIAFMPNLSTGEPLRREYTFLKPTKDDVKKYGKEEGDILVMSGPNNTDAIIKSDGTIIYNDNPAAPNWMFSVVSPDLYTAVENKDKVTFPLGENPNLEKMGMISLNQEFPEELTGSPDEGPDPEFISALSPLEPKIIKPTKQQQAVIDAVVDGKDVIVQALAGTGKTSTLKMAARAVAEKYPDKTILYIAFGKAVAAELNADPDRPSNMIARTNTQVAWHHAPTWMQQRSFKKDSIGLPSDVADHLGIGPVKVVEIKKDGEKVNATLSSREVVKSVRDAVTAFAQSADEKIMPKHFTDNFVDIPEVFIDYANRWWDDISSPKGKLTMNQSYPEKYVQLNGIDVTMSPDSETTNPDKVIPAADIIFFDEAQDINDVAGDWVRKQPIQKVFVGDGNQSIYGWRGAKDQLDTLEGAEKLQLTESFRFGPNIAAVANRFLAVAGKPEKVIGLSKNEGKIVEDLADMPDPDAVLVRTNGGAFKAMIEYLDQNKTVGISQSTKTRLEEAIETATWIMNGKKKDSKPSKYNAELGMYDSWEEIGLLIKDGKAREVKSLYDLINQNGIQNLRDILGRVVVEREETAESKAALAKYKPLTLDKVEDGSTGKIDSSVTYKIEGNDIVLTGFFKYNNEKLKEAGFKARKDKDGNWAKDRRLTIEDDLKKVDKLNQLKKILEGVIEPVKADVVITTAHQSKGAEYDSVRIYDDFWGPKDVKGSVDKELPAPEELRLAYVAVTRAKKEIYLGPLTWVYDHTSEEDEQVTPSSSTIEAMSNIETDPTPVTPEEFDNEVQETAKKIDPATQRIADAIIASLENGNVPWRKPWTGAGFLPTSVATGKVYEGSNVISLWAAQQANGWVDNRWLTYKQAEKLGGNIKRGEKATSIIHWAPKFKQVDQPDGTTKDVFIYTPPKIINVFNVEQAEGLDLPPLVTPDPIPVSDAERILLETFKDHPKINYGRQDSAYYMPINDNIYLPLREQFGSEQDLFETLVHELAHSTGHPSRVNRTELLENYGNHKASRGEEELIAEISVAIVAGRLGVEIDFGNITAYAQSWLRALKNDPTMIIKAAKQAQKAVDHMLGKQEEPAKVDEEGNPTEPVGEGVGSEGKTGDQIAEDAGLKPESTPEPNVGEQGRTGEEIAEDDIKPAGVKGGHSLSPREVYSLQVAQSDLDIKKVYAAEEVWTPQQQRPFKPPVAPKRADFSDSDSYKAAFKKYSKDYDDAYREMSRYVESPLGEKHLNGSAKGVKNYVEDIITADWFVEAFGDGGRMGRPPVSLITSKKAGGKYSYGFKDGVFFSTLKINSLLSRNEPSILHEIAHFATAISVAEGMDAHGVEYRMNYIYITDKVLGREAAEGLKESYRKANLNVG
jgi:antirestriction protein ArdC/DNA polymerase III epsilon subunit-like protein